MAVVSVNIAHDCIEMSTMASYTSICYAVTCDVKASGFMSESWAKRSCGIIGERARRTMNTFEG
ncbi:MAG: hypothetical protein LZF60_290002 [Nitrospira sp.]|nr:MAG: hypothetical protein LZF60_290002 [Nitrospira sp.]